ncbi:MAG: hypothetical protein A2Y24_01295 [Clostridiales bacterium GWE2_32_10]|nr:MAG: hypothetical protein A2Y24_01295 [Clostridiales bacterium GWE2_32_10]HBY20641.1 hypothetical protein [Clostridiales bacterium]
MTYPIIDIHASWLVINPIQGCPNSCKYCFLNANGKTKVRPEVLASPEETVGLLLNSKLYDKYIPICLFSQTDAFATSENVEYLKKILKILHDMKICNPKIFITKCYIPDDFIDYISSLEEEGEKFIFYLSYSGLDSDIEVGIKRENIESNFKRLFEKNKKIIHYWRPFLPQNSSKKLVEKMLSFVSKYALASVVTGLKVQKEFIDKLEFWPEIIQNREEVLMAEGVWPKQFYEYFWNERVKTSKYPIYQSNSCAIAYVLGLPDRNAFYDSELCNNINVCPANQKTICKKHCENMCISESKIIEILRRLDIDMANLKIDYDYERNNFKISKRIL